MKEITDVVLLIVLDLKAESLSSVPFSSPLPWNEQVQR